MDQNIKKRTRISTKKWQEDEEMAILIYFKKIIQNNLEIEKPSASVFYEKMIVELKWENLSAKKLKNKVRNLKNTYLRAKEWQIKTGESVDVGSVREHILSICPHWDFLNEIYGSKTNIKPTYVYDSFIHDDAVTVDDNVIYQPDGSCEQSTVDSDELNPIQQPTPEIAREPDVETGEPLEKFKRYLSTTPTANKRPRTSSNSSSPLSEAQMMRAKAIAEKNKIEEKWKEEEIRLNREIFDFEKSIRTQQLELETKKLESNERLKILKLEKEERIAKYKIDSKRDIELAKINKI